MDAKQLIRTLGAKDLQTREAAALRLAQMGERSAMRPLLNAYLNYGDPAAIKALSTFGATLAPAAIHESMDMGVMGARRARLMDVLGVTGVEECLNAVRASVDDADPDIHVRACVAMARLGDMFGIDKLADDLRSNSEGRRTLAFKGLLELGTPRAKTVVDERVRAYLAEAGAVPSKIEVSAPLLADPDLNLVTYVCEHIKRSPHSLTVVIGSAAIQMASNRRDAIKQHLPGWELHFATVMTPPEEQIAGLFAARDAAAADADARAVYLGMLPGPHDSPPLPHFLTRPEDESRTYTAKIIAVDPHEYLLLQEWLHYIEDRAEVSTDFEVILAVSRPGRSAMTEEELMIYMVLPDAQKPDFARAYLAHT